MTRGLRCKERSDRFSVARADANPSSFFVILFLGPPFNPFLVGRVPLLRIDYRKRVGTLILTSLLEDQVSLEGTGGAKVGHGEARPAALGRFPKSFESLVCVCVCLAQTRI